MTYRDPPERLLPCEAENARLKADLEYADRCMTALFVERDETREIIKAFDLTDVGTSRDDAINALRKQLRAALLARVRAWNAGYEAALTAIEGGATPGYLRALTKG